MYAHKTTTADILILHGEDTLRYQHISIIVFTILSLSRSTPECSCYLHTSDIHAPSRALAVFSLLWLSHCFIASLIKTSLLE